jgi:NADPH2:quinone reductase
VRAVQIREFGGPDVLELVDDAPLPKPGEGEVLIKVSRAGINFADTHSRENAYVAKYELPFTPGAEVAGVREDTGERVVALIDTGGYAEYAVAPAARTFPVPEGLDDGTALALLIQGLNAWHLYRTAAKVQPGETVVVHGAAGGVGSLAVQLGRPMGAGRVIASASSEEKRALALELGADAAVDSAPDGLKQRLVEANAGRPVDVVFEIAGGRVFDESIEALAPFGRIVVNGIATKEQNELRTGRLLRKSWSVVGFWLMHCLGRRELMEEPLADLFARAARGELRAHVGTTYPLSQVRRAHEDLAGRRTQGKLLLDPSS